MAYWGRARRAATVLTAASALVLAVVGCGLGDKEDMADAVIDAVEAAHRAGSARGTITGSMRIAELPGDVALGDVAGAGDAAQQAVEAPAAHVTIDFAAGRALLAYQQRPFQIFDGSTIYGYRFDAGEREARPWVKVDLETSEDLGELDPQQDPPVLLVNALSPVLLVDLAAGALTGSIERAGTDELAGVPVTGYRANFDLEKTLRDTREDAYDEDRREAIGELYDALKIKGTVHRGEAWLDGEGMLRRFVLTVPVEPRHGFVVDVGLRLDLTGLGEPVTIDPPSDGELLEVGSLIGLFRTVFPSTGGAIAPPGEGPTP